MLHEEESYLTRHNSVGEFKFSRHFKWGKRLGKGSFGSVSEVVHCDSGAKFAIKSSTQSFKGTKHRSDLLNEMKVAAKMQDHPNVVTYHRAWQDSPQLSPRTLSLHTHKTG